MLTYTTLSKQLQFNPRTPYHKLPPGSGADNTAARRLITWSHGNTRHTTTAGSRKVSSDLTTLPRSPAWILTCNKQNAAFQRPAGNGEKLNFRRIVYSTNSRKNKLASSHISHVHCADPIPLGRCGTWDQRCSCHTQPRLQKGQGDTLGHKELVLVSRATKSLNKPKKFFP